MVIRIRLGESAAERFERKARRKKQKGAHQCAPLLKKLELRGNV